MQKTMLLSQLIWGAPQSLLGLLIFLRFVKNKHFMYHGIIVTEWSFKGSISLGAFIFVPPGSHPNILVHEYGHTIQSLLLGPFYLLVIGIPSFLWSLLYNKRKPYTRFYTERNADYFGTKLLKHDSLERKYL